jgi:hypothetical protein
MPIILAEIGRIVRPHLNRKKLGMVVHACHSHNSRKYKIGLWSMLAWKRSKIKIKAKRARSVAQPVVLSSNPSNTKKQQ